MPGQIKNRGEAIRFQMMSVVRDRFFFALGIVLAVVARGVDGRIVCLSGSYGYSYAVADTAKCWVDTMNKRFGRGGRLMEMCNSPGWVSCCPVGVDKRCALLGVGVRARSWTCLSVRACVPPTPLHPNTKLVLSFACAKIYLFF